MVQVAEAQENEVVVRHLVSQRRRHEIWEWRHGWICRTCGRTFHADSYPERLENAECGGAVHSRLLDSMGALGPLDAWDCYTSQELIDQGGKRWSKTEEERQAVAETETHLATAVRKRVVGKQPDPSTRLQSSAPTAVKENESGHILIKAGRYTFCDRCGRWAIDRFGPGLIRKCKGSVDTSLGAYRVRRDRLRAGRHPVTNRLIG